MSEERTLSHTRLRYTRSMERGWRRLLTSVPRLPGATSECVPVVMRRKIYGRPGMLVVYCDQVGSMTGGASGKARYNLVSSSLYLPQIEQESLQSVQILVLRGLVTVLCKMHRAHCAEDQHFIWYVAPLCVIASRYAPPTSPLGGCCVTQRRVMRLLFPEPLDS